MKRILILMLVMLPCLMVTDSCEHEDSDRTQSKQQEKILAEGTAQTGMPAIKNFRERKIAKDILELRDQEGLVTYTYLYSEMTSKLTFFCTSVGFALPAASQYTSPQKIAEPYTKEYLIMPQADPNGLFSPASAEGTWVLCNDPVSKKTVPVYVEPRIIVSPFQLTAQ